VLADFCRAYGLAFRDKELLKLALTHRSYLSVTGQGPRESNERLEFLGDSVLGLVTSEYLYRRFPDEHEGQLTKIKSLLVSKAILSRRALHMGLGRYMLLSHSEVESGGRQRLSILADAFESVIGAVYLDLGFEAARAFIERWLLRDAEEIVADKRHTNYKSALQEYVQNKFRTHPVYRIRSEMGPDHSKHFHVEVVVGRRTLGEGRGANKKDAEQAAARDAIERVGGGPRREAREDPDDRPRRPRRSERDEDAAPAEPVETRPRRDDDESPERPHRGAPRRDREPVERATPPAAAAPPRAAGPVAPGVEPLRPAAESRFEKLRLETDAVGEDVEVVEVEPPPSLHEEDDLEEVGRPEGPLEERRVDVYGWEPRTAAAAGTPGPRWEREAVPGVAAAEEEAGMEGQPGAEQAEEPPPPEAIVDEEFPPAEARPWGERAEPPAREPAPPAPEAGAAFGRRRTRRGR
jgi:ribonuclease-3